MKAIIVQIDRQPKIIKLFILITQEIYSLRKYDKISNIVSGM
jgi:hypothetical protein